YLSAALAGSKIGSCGFSQRTNAAKSVGLRPKPLDQRRPPDSLTPRHAGKIMAAGPEYESAARSTPSASQSQGRWPDYEEEMGKTDKSQKIATKTMTIR